MPPYPSGAQDQLNGPPPSPTPMGGGGDTPFSMRGLAPQQIPTSGMPPEVLTGIMQSSQTIASLLDSYAQATPDKAAQLSLIKDLLQQYIADLMTAGGGPVSSTYPGMAAPMGGLDHGLSGAGAVGAPQ